MSTWPLCVDVPAATAAFTFVILTLSLWNTGRLRVRGRSGRAGNFPAPGLLPLGRAGLERLGDAVLDRPRGLGLGQVDHVALVRSEERRVGKEGRCRWAPEGE